MNSHTPEDKYVSDFSMLCRISAGSGNSEIFFYLYENAIFNGEQEKESILCARVG